MRCLGLIAAALIGLSMQAAQAAPQMLGLFATGPNATELNCEDGVCSAQFTAFCLQQNRDAPLDGTAYTPAGDAPLRFVLTDSAGLERSVPAKDMTIRSARNYTAVVISVPEKTVRSLGAVRIALSVGERASLLPVPVANDPNPMTEAEIVAATGRNRAVGESIVEQSGHMSDAVRASMTVINTLRGGAAEAAGTTEATVARRMIDRAALPVKVHDMVSDRIAICANLKRSVWYKKDLAYCLQGYHDSFVSTLNGDYWNAVGTGS